MTEKTRIIVASRNPHKVREIGEMLGSRGLEVSGLDEFGDIPEVVEDGDTFRDNACKKASETARMLGLPVLADDSGLEVAALGGQPGVRSARYAGESSDDARNLLKLLKEMEGVTDRAARFVCVVAVADAGGRIVGTVEGTVEGTLLEEGRGSGGFGYDPAFVPHGYSKTFAQLPGAEKNRLSHRAAAISALLRSGLVEGLLG